MRLAHASHEWPRRLNRGEALAHSTDGTELALLLDRGLRDQRRRIRLLLLVDLLVVLLVLVLVIVEVLVAQVVVIEVLDSSSSSSKSSSSSSMMSRSLSSTSWSFHCSTVSAGSDSKLVELLPRPIRRPGGRRSPPRSPWARRRGPLSSPRCLPGSPTPLAWTCSPRHNERRRDVRRHQRPRRQGRGWRDEHQSAGTLSG